MKKGIIINFNDDKAIVMTSDGVFCEMKAKCAEIGDRINLSMSSKTVISSLLMVLVFMGVFSSSIIGAIMAFRTPVAYVALDINPSVEYTVNKFGQVLSVNGLNDDGNVIIADSNFKNLQVEDAVNMTVKNATEAGYLFLPNLQKPVLEQFSGNMNAVMLTVISDDDSRVQQFKEEIYSGIKNYFENMHIFGLILTQDGDYKYRMEAQLNGMSVGKMELVNRVCGAVSFHTAKEMSVKELATIIRKQHENPSQSEAMSQFKSEFQTYIDLNKRKVDLYQKQFDEDIVYSQIVSEYESFCKEYLESLSNDWDEAVKNWRPPYIGQIA